MKWNIEGLNVTWEGIAYLLVVLLAFMVLLAAIMAPAKLRRIALTLLQRTIQAAAVICILGCAGAFFLRATGPRCLLSVIQRIAEFIAPVAGNEATRLAWLAIAVAVCCVAAPVAITLGFTRRLDAISSWVRRLGRVPPQSTLNAAVPADRLGDAGWSGCDEVEEAVQIVRDTTKRTEKGRRQRLGDLI